MTPRGRRAVRIAILGLAVIFAGIFGVAAVGATRSALAADALTHNHLVLVAVGAWLKAIGMVGLYVSTAVGFRDWATFALPFAPAFGSLGLRRGWRRTRRQIDGEEGYEASEVEHLRAVARYRLALVARGTGRTAQASSLSLALFFLGMVLAPLGLGPVLDRGYSVLAVVMTVVLLVSLPFMRRRTDAKAQAFLSSTSSRPDGTVRPGGV